MKRAFTLIELLVVIAIIAILAAILFPVFAQAKLSAKAAVALSDVKQQSLAIIMYSSDDDDVWVNSCSWNTGSDPLTFGNGLAFSTWTWLVNPYQKNQDIDVDPLGPLCPVPGGWPKIIAESFNPTFGYNDAALAPYNRHSHPLTCTTVEKPSTTVMLDAKFSENGEWAYGNGGNVALLWSGYQANSDNGPILNTTIGPPDCTTINGNYEYCVGNWGTGSQWAGILKPGGEVAGSLTGGNSLRGIGAGEVAFCDGHVKKMLPGNLSAGTNWSETRANGQLSVTDSSIYLWWAIPGQGH